uniref:Solute carrier family 22 member 23 n=1 Tax=Kryptolebias marmoratus TaxID=37003 RepID=A0A3Q3ARL9_KRYMA
MAVVQLDTGDAHQPENGFVTPEAAASPPGPLRRIDSIVLPFLGGFGRYQKQLIALTWIPALFIGFSQYSDTFLLNEPNSTCIQPNLTEYHFRGGGAPESGLSGGLRNASGNDSRPSIASSMQCVPNCTKWSFEIQTGLVENVVTKWELVCGSAWIVHIAKFSLLVGSIFGYLVFGILADWFGRHPVLITSVLFMLMFGLSVAFSFNVSMFSTLRFFEGFCLAGIILSLYVLRIELCLPVWRFSVTMVASFIVLGGQLLMPGVAYLCSKWQVLQAVIICPLLLMLSYIWIFPESLRWLLATQQYGRSKWIIGRIGEKNKVNMELDTDNILTELQRSLQRKPKKTCIVKMVGTRNLWKNIVVLCVNSLTGYGIHHCFARRMMEKDELETSVFDNFYMSYYTMAGTAVTSCILLCPVVYLMGRRGGLLMFMIITALASLLQLGLLNYHSDKLKRNFSIAFSIIGMFSSHAVSNLSIFFCAEITPTVVRGGGLGLVLASAGFGMLTEPIMDLHNQKGYFLHHIIFACCTLICIICILLLPETRYHPLPETLDDCESYARQPILLTSKLGEQHHLLGQSESSRDYTRVHDTPLHEAATTAVSTMGSTASSAVDLTAPVDKDASAPIHVMEKPDQPGPQDPNSHTVASPSPASVIALGKDAVTPAKKEHLLSSSPLHKAPCITDPLLADADKRPAVRDSGDPLTDSIYLEINNLAPSTTSEDNSGPAASLDSSTTTNPETVPSSLLICTTPVLEPPPSTTLESPDLQDDDVDMMVTNSDPSLMDDALPPLAESPPPSMHDSLPPFPVPVTDSDILTQPPPPPPSITSQTDSSPQLQEADESTFTPSHTEPQPPHLDLAPACVKESSTCSSFPPSSPKLTRPQPTDSDRMSPEDISPAVLPVTDIVPDSAVSLVLDSINSSADSGCTAAAPPSLIDGTVSSPIDSGVLPISNGETASTESNTVDSPGST